MNPTLRKITRTPVRAARAVGRGLKQLTSMLFSASVGLVWSLLPNTRFDYAREVGDGLGSSVVVAPLLWIARNFPEAPLQVLADGEPADEHQMVQLIRRPNPHYSGIILWMATIVSWVVDGNAYWVKVRNRIGGVNELWYVPHWAIEPKGNADEFVSHYDYTVDGRPIRLDPDDVVHFRYGLDQHNMRKGVSPLKSVLREVFTDDEAANFSASLLHNLGVPGLLVSPEGEHTPSKDDVEATKKYVDQEYTGDKRGKPLVMSGPTKVEQFGYSPEQMVLRDLRKIPEERVSGVIGVPAIVAGLGAGLDRSTFSNYAEAREAAYEENIIPTQRIFGEDLRHQLLPDFEDTIVGVEVGWDRSSVRVLQEDRNREAQRLGQLYKDGVLRRGEAREQLNLETGPADDVYAVPISTVLVPSGAQMPAPPEPSREAAARHWNRLPVGHPDRDRQCAECNTVWRQAAAARDCEAKHRRGVKQDRVGITLVNQLDRVGDHLAGIWADELQERFEALGRHVADSYRAVRSRNGHGRKQDDEVDPAEVERILAAANVDGWGDDNLTGSFEQHWGRVADTTVDTINSVLALGLDLPDPVAADLVRRGGRRVGLVDLEGHTRAALFRALGQAREEGLGTDATARLIRAEVPAGRFANAGPQYRAKLIARTETKFAQNVSSLEAYRTSEVVTGVRAFDARLGDTDADCLLRNGQVFDVDEAERVSQQEHPNGTLSWAPVVREAEAVPA